ncbi:IclR family transcriptional regulator [Pseudothermotoga sp.]|uniref:IclR family transcriptional regulator n=1 Tax=Pseudothermotoga sp. TaxID=2033661 RepID=UPI0031F6BB92
MAIYSVERALKVLEYVVSKKSGVRVRDIAQFLNLTAPAAFKHLETLVKCGYIFKDPYTHRYFASYKVVELGSIVLRNMEVREIAHPLLVDLMERTGMTVHFALKDGYEGVYVDKVESAKTIPTVSRIGMRMRLYSTGFGKAILAFLSEEELEGFLKNVQLNKCTPNTITDTERLKRELALVREKGYAIDNEENEYGVKCVGAPVFDYTGKVIGAISVTAAAGLLNEETIPKIAQEVVYTAKEISKKLGA